MPVHESLETEEVLLLNPLPFSEDLSGHGLRHCLVAFAPEIRPARERLLRGLVNLARSHSEVPLDPALIEESLASNLAQPLLQMMSRVMVLELNVARLRGMLSGNTPQERFVQFLNRLRDPEFVNQLLREYPVLTTQIVNHLDRWSAFGLQLIQHFCDDWDALRKMFFNTDPGALVRVQGGAGDTHRGGRSVMILSFASGERIVYKPRSVAVEEHFQHLLQWLNDNGAEPPFQPLKVADRGDHGWAEFVTASPCASPDQLERFYRRQGGFLALLYSLEASDFHCENLIARGEHPFLVDLEALFQHQPANTPSDLAEEVAGIALGSSALRVGMLPIRMWATENNAGVDMSGLGGAAGQLTPHGVPHWERVDTDEMCIVRKRVAIPGSLNRPTLNGREVNASDYTESIVEGFASTYRCILANRDALRPLLGQFSNDEVRVIVRPTHTYATLYQESFHPDVLRSEADRETLLHRLQGLAHDQPAVQKLIPAEQADLLRGDIPLFTTRPGSSNLWTSSGDEIENYFDKAGLSLAESRLLELCDKDLRRQLWIVRASLSTLDSRVEGPAIPKSKIEQLDAPPVPRTQLTPGQLISAARAVGDRLHELAFGGHDDATWVGLVPTDERAWSLCPLGPDLYDGLPGVILFLAHLGSVIGEQSYTSLAESALVTLRRHVEKSYELPSIGAFSGWGGIIYMLAHLGAIWKNPSMYSEAQDLLDRLPELVRRDRSFDVIGGAAGCVLALRSLHSCRTSTRLLEIAQACGEHLIDSAQPTARGIGWLCGSHITSPLTGFAHGNAGIACALIALYEMTGEQRFEQTALQALEYERSLFSPANGNWPDLRNNATSGYAASWCHGAPGIALSRVHMVGHLNDSLLNSEIDWALATTLAKGFGSNHTLCHGDLGNAEILLHAASVLNREDWRSHAHQKVAAVIEDVREHGWICGNPRGVESPGMMTGLAGIGYAFLRFSDPASIPSVLSLDPPVTRYA